MDFQTDMRKTPFVILRGDKEDCRYIFDLLVPILGPEKRYMRGEPIEAEIIKYMENFYFGWKLSFVNIFYDACQKNKKIILKIFLRQKMKGYCYKNKHKRKNELE